jgi:hypothetical protein
LPTKIAYSSVRSGDAKEDGDFWSSISWQKHNMTIQIGTNVSGAVGDFIHKKIQGKEAKTQA